MKKEGKIQKKLAQELIIKQRCGLMKGIVGKEKQNLQSGTSVFETKKELKNGIHFFIFYIYIYSELASCQHRLLVLFLGRLLSYLECQMGFCKLQNSPRQLN